MATWKAAGREVTCPVAGMGSFPVPGCEPVRHFTWRTGQGHRPGLQSVAGTGRLHGFESHAEQCLLLALDFLGVLEVVSQPHRMPLEPPAGRPAEVRCPGGGALLPGSRPRVRDSPDLAPGPGYRPGGAVRGQRPGLAGPAMSGTDRGPVELSAGCRLVLAGTQWQVDWFEPHT